MSLFCFFSFHLVDLKMFEKFRVSSFVPEKSLFSMQTATCVSGNLVSGSGWLNGNGAFGELTCSSHSFHEAQATNNRCWGNNLVIR